MGINWNWAAEKITKGGEGFNDAGILTFNSHVINSFVREMFQNSNDARGKNHKKIKIKIEYKEIPKKLIPSFDQFEEVLALVKESNPNQIKFFNKAKDALSKETVAFLIYSDSNTLGLSGGEEDEDSSFYACLLSEGKSAKENNNAGGSFGIGKNAIYGISNLRTVLYSSLNEENDFIFQGVAKLASYKKDGQKYDNRIYLGVGEDRLSVRDNKEIPDIFKRTEPGLSQFVLGVDLDENWVKDFIQAILRNYWSLLLDDGLDVELVKNGITLQKITVSNAIQLIKEHFSPDSNKQLIPPNGNPLYFTEAIAYGEKCEFQIPHIGKCVFHYFESPYGDNNVAYLRNGMVVFTERERRLVGASITGVFKCETSEGNEILRQMEPPKHDSFEPQMLEDKHATLRKADGEKITGNIKEKIRSQIRSLIEKYKQEIETPSFVSELFEDLQQSIEAATRGTRKNEKSNIETLPRRAANEKITVSLISNADNLSVTQKNGDVSEMGVGKGIGSNKGSNPGGGSGGKGNSGGPKKGGTGMKKDIFSRVFFYSTDKERNIHKGIIRANPDISNVELSLSQYADSGQEVAFILHSIKDDKGILLPFSERKDSNDIIIDYSFIIPNLQTDVHVYFEVSENQKSAFILNG